MFDEHNTIRISQIIRRFILSQPNKNTLSKYVLTISLAFIAVIIALPYGIKFGLIKGLAQSGAKQVTIDDVDFNLFTGKLFISHLRAKKQQHTELSVDSLMLQVDWLPLFKKRLHIASASIKNSSLLIENVDEETLYIGGIRIPLGTKDKNKKEDKPPSWGIGLDKLRLINSSFTYQSPIISDDFTINDLTINQALSWKPEQSSDFSFKTQLNQGFISGDISVSMFSDNPLMTGQLRIQKLNLHDFQPLVKEHLQELKGHLNSDIEFTLSIDKNVIDYKHAGSLSISQATMATPSLKNTLAFANWNGTARYITTPDTPTLSLKGQLELDEFSSINPQTNMRVATANKFVIKNLAINQIQDIQASSIEVDQLSLATDDLSQTLMGSRQMLIQDFQLQNLKDVDINQIKLNGLTAQIDLDTQNEIALLKKLTDSLPAKEENSTVKTNESTEPAQFHLTNLTISKNSHIKFSKETKQGSIKKDIHLDQVDIGELNSLYPNNATPINLKATIDKFSALSIKGNIYPFHKKTNAALQSSLSAFELNEISPLIREQLGYNIQQGQLNADLKINIKDNLLDGQTSLQVNQLILEAADENKMAKMTQQLSMPLDSALSLLRDGNDDIKLNIPIKGDLASPDFDISDIINTALGNALQGTVKSFLKYTLQPYGLIFMAAEKAYGVATAIKLDAIPFPPGQDTLPLESANYLKRVGELMQKRPQLRIRICGFATEQDHLFLQNPSNKTKEIISKEQQDQLNQEALLDLAKKRQMAVKSHLLSTYQLETTRLFTCHPKIDTSKTTNPESTPRVELLI